MVSISYLMVVCWIVIQIKTGCRISVKKPLREDADRAYETAVVPEGILCGVPSLRDPKIWLASLDCL